MAKSSAQATVRTQILILSDTHGMALDRLKTPRQSADVAIHCGDLTDESKLDEFHSSLRLLKAVDAPLKLVIAGNHDFTLDTLTFQKKIQESTQHLEADLVKKVYGDYGEVKRLFAEAAKHGVHLLDEGTHRFTLGNGARLTVYASPYTPSLGDWGFQYRPDQGHLYAIEDGTDIVITHGPPHGVLDRTHGRERAGSSELFAAIARSKPRIHCYGHIHEAWGAKLVTWRETICDNPSHLTDIDHAHSTVIEQLSTIQRTKIDTPETAKMKEEKAARYRAQWFCGSSHCLGDENALIPGKQTLFVNSAIKGDDDEGQTQLPWLITLELPKEEEHGDLRRTKTVKTAGATDQSILRRKRSAREALLNEDGETLPRSRRAVEEE